MVYSHRFVMSILVNGHVLPENNGIVPIKFGDEYSIRFRNKNNVRAAVQFKIDDENVSGEGFIIPANGYIDIHRHADKDARFKFVELDSPEAVDFGKNGPNDGSKGVIEAKFFLEKMPKYQPIRRKEYKPRLIKSKKPWSDSSVWPESKKPWSDSSVCPESKNLYVGPSSIACSGIMQPDAVPDMQEFGFTMNENNLKDGCTVEGSTSGQKFTKVHMDLESNYVVLICTLKGITDNCISSTPSLTYCTQCGAKKSREKDNFCGVCGHRF